MSTHFLHRPSVEKLIPFEAGKVQFPVLQPEVMFCLAPPDLVMLLMMATILPLSNPFPLNFNMKKFELMSKAVATLMVTFSVKST